MLCEKSMLPVYPEFRNSYPAERDFDIFSFSMEFILASLKGIRHGYIIVFLYLKLVLPPRGSRDKNCFFDHSMMTFEFLDVIFEGKGLEMHVFKPQRFIWSYHTHVIHTR